MNALAQLVIGAAGAALLMLAWALVQQRWLRRFAPREADALEARRGLQAAGNSENCNSGCAGCSSSRECANHGGA